MTYMYEFKVTYASGRGWDTYDLVVAPTTDMAESLIRQRGFAPKGVNLLGAVGNWRVPSVNGKPVA